MKKINFVINPNKFKDFISSLSLVSSDIWFELREDKLVSIICDKGGAVIKKSDFEIKTNGYDESFKFAFVDVPIVQRMLKNNFSVFDEIDVKMNYINGFGIDIEFKKKNLTIKPKLLDSFIKDRFNFVEETIFSKIINSISSLFQFELNSSDLESIKRNLKDTSGTLIYIEKNAIGTFLRDDEHFFTTQIDENSIQNPFKRSFVKEYFNCVDINEKNEIEVSDHRILFKTPNSITLITLALVLDED